MCGAAAAAADAAALLRSGVAALLYSGAAALLHSGAGALLRSVWRHAAAGPGQRQGQATARRGSEQC
eukprot:1360262-Alexandrium_andersonii.AAC.1